VAGTWLRTALHAAELFRGLVEADFTTRTAPADRELARTACAAAMVQWSRGVCRSPENANGK
jgi:hypothetical protein